MKNDIKCVHKDFEYLSDYQLICTNCLYQWEIVQEPEPYILYKKTWISQTRYDEIINGEIEEKLEQNI